MPNEDQWKQGQEWRQQYPTGFVPPKASESFKTGAGLPKK